MSTRFIRVNAFDMDDVEGLDAETRELVERRRRVLSAGVKLFYERPLELVRGEGTAVYDSAGRRYLDAYNNVPSIGHCHPRWVEAVTSQAAALNTNTRYLSRRILDYGERLLATHGTGLDRAIFTSSGSEAVDVALRVAFHATGRGGVVVTENAYHGVTAATAAISPSFGGHANAAAHVRAVSAPRGVDLGAARERFRGDVADAIKSLEAAGTGVAALVFDSIFASDGLLTEPRGLLAEAAEMAHAAGALLICDEVQAGFGRTGEAMWGYQRHDVAPDLAAMGKPMGGGMPAGGVVGRAELIDAFTAEVGFFSTFGGSSVPVAAASTVLEVIEEEGLLESVGAVGGRLGAALRALAVQCDVLGEVRGVGLYWMMDVVDGDRQPDPSGATSIVNAMRDRGVLISATGPTAATLKIRPPLPFSTADGEQLLAALADVLSTADSVDEAVRGE
jgi:4-aminobutyrate aminotransferase-like enzyme